VTPQAINAHIQLLEDSRRDFLASLNGLPEAQAAIAPEPGRWSALECVEHVANSEGRFLGWLENAAVEGAPPADKEKEAALAARMSNRATRVQAPDVVRPAGRFATLADAIAEFEATRARTIQLVAARGADLYSLAAKHPFFGPINGAEVVILIANHARRHAEQIREVRAALGSSEQSRTGPNSSK
jgi:hypothetical protein